MGGGGGGDDQTGPLIVLIPSPGIGHLIPLAELANRLVSLNFSIRFLIPTDGSPTKSQVSLLKSLPAQIHHTFLPPADLTDLPATGGVISRILHTMTRSIPPLAESLAGLAKSKHLVATVLDSFGSPLIDLPSGFGVPAYIFYTSSAFSLSAAFHLPKLHESYNCEYRDIREPIQVFPGSIAVNGVDFTESAQDRKAEGYKHFLQTIEGYKKAVGIMVNSFQDLEPAAHRALSNQLLDEIPPVYLIGPMTLSVSYSPTSDGSDHQALKWLDAQPCSSVLFVSFGSGGTLSRDQLAELAFGLEMSGVRFLWVIKSPNDKAPNGSFFSQESVNDPLLFYPDGFIDRTKGVGLVVPSWAPQIQILSHGSTGGFLTHCGWNSTLESIVHGVPLIGWPLFAEQSLNAAQLTDDLKVALRVKPNGKGIVDRWQVAEYAKDLIEGEKGKVLKKRMQVLKESAKATTLGEHGASTKQLEELARIWRAKGRL